MKRSESCPPTHIMHIHIPLNLSGFEHSQLDAVQDALKLSLSISRAAFFGQICDESTVDIEEVK
jgi:hypothetical protein